MLFRSAGLRGAGQVFLRKGKDQALDFSVGFDDRSLDQFRISNPLLHEPHVPMSEEVLNFNLRKLMHFLTPIINEKLQQMPFTLPKAYAQTIPCNHALAVGDTCPMQLRKVSVAGVANFAYLQIQEQQAIPTVTPDEHAEQDGKRLPVVLPWGQPVYAFSLPSQLSWLCLRCSNAIMLCAVSCGVALALFAALRTICCDPEVQPYAPLAPEDSRAVARQGGARSRLISTLLIDLVALLLVFHSIFWSIADPFMDFSVESLTELGVGESLNVRGAVGQLQSWTGLGASITLLEGFAVMTLLIVKTLRCQFLETISEPVKDHWPHIQLYICMLALITQAMLIIGLPMLVTVGQILACKVDDTDDKMCAL